MRVFTPGPDDPLCFTAAEALITKIPVVNDIEEATELAYLLFASVGPMTHGALGFSYGQPLGLVLTNLEWFKEVNMATAAVDSLVADAPDKIGGTLDYLLLILPIERGTVEGKLAMQTGVYLLTREKVMAGRFLYLLANEQMPPEVSRCLVDVDLDDGVDGLGDGVLPVLRDMYRRFTAARP